METELIGKQWFYILVTHKDHLYQLSQAQDPAPDTYNLKKESDLARKCGHSFHGRMTPRQKYHGGWQSMVKKNA